MGGRDRRARVRRLSRGLGEARPWSRTRLRGDLDDGPDRRPARGADRRDAGGPRGAGVVRAPARPARRSPLGGREPGARSHRLDEPADQLLRRARLSYGCGSRLIVRLRTCPPTTKPICANSPVARIVVATSSLPLSGPSGLGGGSDRRRAVNSGAAARTARGFAARLGAGPRRGLAAPRRGDPSRWGRVWGSAPSTPFSFARGFAFAFGALSAMGAPSVRSGIALLSTIIGRSPTPPPYAQRCAGPE